MSKLSNNRQQRNVKDGVAIVSAGASGGMRKIRSPLGHQLAVPTVDSQGNSVLRTTDGRTFVSKRIK